MIDFEALAAAMGELDEDTVKEILEEVMAQGGQDANAAMEACQKGISARSPGYFPSPEFIYTALLQAVD